MGTQHIVPENSRASIFRLALSLRAKFQIDDMLSFNIVDLIRQMVGMRFKDGFIFHVEIFREEKKDLAYVKTENPSVGVDGKITLYVHEEIWRDASVGEPKSRYILAHELGHVLLHRGPRQAYSDAGNSPYKNFPPERQAEAHANWFADGLLAPDHLVSSFASEASFANRMDFPEEYAVRRMEEVREETRKRGFRCAINL